MASEKPDRAKNHAAFPRASGLDLWLLPFANPRARQRAPQRETGFIAKVHRCGQLLGLLGKEKGVFHLRLSTQMKHTQINLGAKYHR